MQQVIRRDLRYDSHLHLRFSLVAPLWLLLLGTAVAASRCGNHVDECQCGLANPFPCGDNNGNGVVTDTCDGKRHPPDQF